MIEGEYDDYIALRRSQNLNKNNVHLQDHISIPYFKIFQGDGNVLKSHLEKKDAEPVLMKVDMSLFNPDNRVEYELWYSSLLDIDQDALKELAIYQEPFGNWTLFTPRILTFDC